MDKQQINALLQKVPVVDCSIDEILYFSPERLNKKPSVGEHYGWQSMHLWHGITWYVKEFIETKLNGYEAWIGLEEQFKIGNKQETVMIIRFEDSRLYIWQNKIRYLVKSRDNPISGIVPRNTEKWIANEKGYFPFDFVVTRINNLEVLKTILKNSEFTAFIGIRKNLFERSMNYIAEYYKPEERLYVSSPAYYLSVPIKLLVPEEYESQFGAPHVSEPVIFDNIKIAFIINSVHYYAYKSNTYMTVNVVFNLKTCEYERFEFSELRERND